jgi:hypothetical protein
VCMQCLTIYHVSQMVDICQLVIEGKDAVLVEQ